MDIIEVSRRAIPFLVKGIIVTFNISLISGILAIIVGIMGGFFRNSNISIVRLLSSLYVTVFRCTPFLIQLYIAYYVLPNFGLRLNILQTGIGTLVFNSGAYLSEIFRAGIDAVPKEQTEAALSLGMTPFLKSKLIIFPQVVRIVIPPVVGQLILLVKDTSVISLIGIFDVVKIGKELANTAWGNPLVIYGWVAFFYFIVCYPIYLYSIKLEKKFRSHYS
jgi:polar amino acid transport system permease protein